VEYLPLDDFKELANAERVFSLKYAQWIKDVSNAEPLSELFFLQ
jgi:hypothetical protein